MSSRNGSFASKVDRMVVKKSSTSQERAKAAASKPKSKPRGPKSPESSKSAFNHKAPKPIAKKAQRATGYLTPAPGREPQPRGMGEQGVNWRVHNMRMKMLRETTKGSFSQASGAKAKFKSKAAYAAKKYGQKTPAHIKDQYKDNSR